MPTLPAPTTRLGFVTGPNANPAGVIFPAGTNPVVCAVLILGCNLSSIPSLFLSTNPGDLINLAEAACGVVAVPYIPKAGLYIRCC